MPLVSALAASHAPNILLEPGREWEDFMNLHYSMAPQGTASRPTIEQQQKLRHDAESAFAVLRAGLEDAKPDVLIVVANDLSPADTIQFKNLKIGGFVTDLGGATSHTAIVARSLAIPAVVGMQHARPLIQDDDLLIVDGTRGALIVDPDIAVLQEYRLRKAELGLERTKLKRLVGARTQTLDGESVELHANIELPQDTERAREVGADGVGLFRTEFLFMNRDELPGEEEQFEAYRAVIKAMGDRPVTIRTLDIGADKNARALRSLDGETEPVLRQHGLLTRDGRMKERKKYGLHGARRGTQFSKR